MIRLKSSIFLSKTNKQVSKMSLEKEKLRKQIDCMMEIKAGNGLAEELFNVQ